MENKYLRDERYRKGWNDGYEYAYSNRKDSISAGSSCFLVKDASFCSENAPFLAWLEMEGFRRAKLSVGSDHGITWFFINLNSKLYCRGKCGVRIAQVVADHAITTDEFITIYQIYKKYEGKRPLEF